jgi:hypothetical protein
VGRDSHTRTLAVNSSGDSTAENTKISKCSCGKLSITPQSSWCGCKYTCPDVSPRSPAQRRQRRRGGEVSGQ